MPEIDERKLKLIEKLMFCKKDVRVMLEEISKIEYPINRELNNLKKAFMDSYVMK